jgi:hypothetical protein
MKPITFFQAGGEVDKGEVDFSPRYEKTDKPFDATHPVPKKEESDLASADDPKDSSVTEPVNLAKPPNKAPKDSPAKKPAG